jgi:hypothetical protein
MYGRLQLDAPLPIYIVYLISYSSLVHIDVLPTAIVAEGTLAAHAGTMIIHLF